MMEIYGTIQFKLILPHFPGFQQEPLPAPVCSHSPDCKDCPYLVLQSHLTIVLPTGQTVLDDPNTLFLCGVVSRPCFM